VTTIEGRIAVKGSKSPRQGWGAAPVSSDKETILKILKNPARETHSWS
jgi:hypothetical protein